MTITEFVNNLFYDCLIAEPITVEDAADEIEEWIEDGVELPEGLTAEAFAKAWNKMIEEEE